MNLKINKKTIVILATIGLIALIVGSAFFILNGNNNSGELEPVKIANLQAINSVLVYVAQNQSYFLKNGLNVTSQDYVGTAPLDNLLNGNADIAVTSEFPIVGKVLNNANISVIATIDKSETVYVVGRRDRGIENASDLIGKRIALTQGSIVEFYLSRYLDLNGINQQDVTVVYIQSVAQKVNAVVNGSVDAIVSDTSRYAVQAQLGENAVTLLPVQVGQSAFISIVGRNDWINNNPETINKLLKAIDQTAIYIANNPSEAKLIVQNKLNLTGVDINDWSSHEFSLSLEQSLVVAMKDEAQFMINNQLTNQTQVPNMVNCIYTDGLKAVKPDAVTIIK
jgi:ABC-type nitrate/sulfonate/bicarbonate transport system substrate-binding protein